MDSKDAQSPNTVEAAEKWLKSARNSESESGGFNYIISQALIASEPITQKRAQELGGDTAGGITFRGASYMRIAAEPTPDSAKFSGFMLFMSRKFGPKGTANGDFTPVPIKDCLKNNGLEVYGTLYPKDPDSSSVLADENDVSNLETALPKVANGAGPLNFDVRVDQEPSNVSGIVRQRVMTIDNITLSGEPVDLQVEVYLGFSSQTDQMIHDMSLKTSATLDTNDPNDENNYIEILGEPGIHIALAKSDGLDFSVDDPDLYKKLSTGLNIATSVYGILAGEEKSLKISDRSADNIVALNQDENDPVWYADLSKSEE